MSSPDIGASAIAESPGEAPSVSSHETAASRVCKPRGAMKVHGIHVGLKEVPIHLLQGPSLIIPDSYMDPLGKRPP